jgi:hypothetical protein
MATVEMCQENRPGTLDTEPPVARAVWLTGIVLSEMRLP